MPLGIVSFNSVGLNVYLHFSLFLSLSLCCTVCMTFAVLCINKQLKTLYTAVSVLYYLMSESCGRTRVHCVGHSLSLKPAATLRWQCASLCATIVQKTAAVVIENIRTSRTTHLSRHADQLMLWKWTRNWTDTGVEQIFFYVLRLFKCIICIYQKQEMLMWNTYFLFLINFKHWIWRIAAFISK